ncbi:MAG: hypothetical protein HN368_01690 [Spirochaetales bacterium]|nr:hypothetical protein [Spirochaetales bacterium]
MGAIIEMDIEGTIIPAELNDSEISQLFLAALPTEIRMSRWGDEYYGACDISAAESEEAREIMEIGGIAYWAPGRALCLFFGPTPASTDDRPRAASPVVPLGTITGDCTILRSFGGSIAIKVKRS